MAVRTWLAPTCRTLRLAPLLGAILSTAIAWALTAAATGEVPAELAVLGCGAMAAAMSLALDDPAHALLAASPTNERRRLLRRLGITGAIAMAGWLAAPVAAGLLADGPIQAPSTAAAAALALAGVAAFAASQRLHHAARAATAGALLAMAWVAARWLLPASLTDVSNLWLDRPLPVAATALSLVLLGARS